MRTYLLVLKRFKTNSRIRIHIDAHNYLDAARFARNILGNQWNNVEYYVCNCPRGIYYEYMGSRIWLLEDGYHILLPGAIKSMLFASSSYDFSKIKQRLGDILCTL